MPLVSFVKLNEAQKAAVLEMYPPPWNAGPYEWYAFWITKEGRHTKAKGRHSITKEGYKQWLKVIELPSHVRPEKGDLEAWKPGTTFHFSRD